MKVNNTVVYDGVKRTLEGTKSWGILVYAAGGVGEQVTTSLVPWGTGWTPDQPSTMFALAAALVAGRRDLGEAWRPVAGIDGKTGNVVTGPGMLGALALIRGLECRTLPSVDDTPPGNFAVQWKRSVAFDEVQSQIVCPSSLEHPLIILFACGSAAEECATICLPYKGIFDEPGEEMRVCRAVKSVWERLPTHWRFVCAISGKNARVLATPALVGQIGVLKGETPRGERNAGVAAQ